jgi:hypothetical protein
MTTAFLTIQGARTSAAPAGSQASRAIGRPRRRPAAHRRQGRGHQQRQGRDREGGRAAERAVEQHACRAERLPAGCRKTEEEESEQQRSERFDPGQAARHDSVGVEHDDR